MTPSPPPSSTSTSSLELARATVLSRRSHRLSSSSPLPNLPTTLSHLSPSLTLPLLTLSSLLTSRTGTSPPLRVTQLDASLLDAELLTLLTAQVAQALKYIGDGHVFDEWAEEAGAGVKAGLWWLGCWKQGGSYGGVVQGVGLFDGRGRGRETAGPPAQLSGWQKVWFGVGDVGGGYVTGKWEEWMGRWTGDGNPHPLTTLTTSLTTLSLLFSLSNTLLFLLSGTYPTLLHRLLRIRLAPLHTRPSARDISFEYLNRQLVWHAFTEFLLFLLPLVGVSRWRRWVGRAWRRLSVLGKGLAQEKEGEGKKGKLAMLPERTCGICWEEQNDNTIDPDSAVGAGGGVVGSSETDVTNPYEAVPCGCVYCYVCLAGKLEGEEGLGWGCLRCGEVVREGRVWGGDVIEVGRGGKGGSFDGVGGEEELGSSEDAKPGFEAEWARDAGSLSGDVADG